MIMVNGIAVNIGHKEVELIGVHYGGQDVIFAVQLFGKVIGFFIKSLCECIAAVMLKVIGVDIKYHLIENLCVGLQIM